MWGGLNEKPGRKEKKWRDSSADKLQNSLPPQPHHRRLAKQPHDTAPDLPETEMHDSDASYLRRRARGKDKNKNQDYKAAAATTTGTAAARARLCAEPSAHVNRPIAPS